MKRPLRIAIATRIYSPEPSAASFRLAALAKSFRDAGDIVRVLTVKPPQHVAAQEGATKQETGIHVKRFPVLRDRTGYVRGYFQYLSFDVPLFFRILFGPRQDALVVEPPPTTLFFASIAATLRRIPVFAYAADVWSDASATSGAPNAIVNGVRWMEKFGWSRAQGVLSVNEGVSTRVKEIAGNAIVSTVGNGIDTETFSPDGPSQTTGTERPFAIYTGTASEWQGAEVFLDALALLQREGIDLGLVFLGHGTAMPQLKELAAALDIPVTFLDTVPPEVAAEWQRGARISLASIRPGVGYDFAFPTKIFAAWACGTPVVYSGPGPARDVLDENPPLGIGTEHDATEVASALKQLLRSENTDAASIAGWAQQNVSLTGVARRAVDFTHKRLTQVS